MKKFCLLIIGLAVFFTACGDKDMEDMSGIQQYDGYTLLWHDEFDDNSLNLENWGYELGDGTDYGLPSGWGNSELQLYTDDISNASLVRDDDGNDVLEIRAFSNGQGDYTSAKLTSYQKVSVRYGRVEARIKLPEGQGIWPAFWMLGNNFSEYGWPSCGEIDIMESLGHIPNRVSFNAHWVNHENKNESELGEFILSEGTFSDSYHVFTLDWTPDALVYSIDGVPQHTIEIDEHMLEFQRSAYMILNLAVGGNWPGNPDETTVFPQVMAVDYVRVYQQDDLATDPEPAYDPAVETWGVWIDPDLYIHAVNEDYTGFGMMSNRSFGGGGEPNASVSDDAIDGAQSLALEFPGGSWGGLFFEMESAIDATPYQNGHLKFATKLPADFKDAELKLESTGQVSAHQAFLIDYSPQVIADGWVEYSIPLSDLVDLDLTDLKIPFAIWNPYDQNDEFLEGTILIDNLRMTMD